MRLLTALFLIAVTTPAMAHDVYTHLYSPAGRLCCGGDPVTGDCEPVTYTMRPSGDVEMMSKRYKTSVLVSKDKITWSQVPGSPDEAHWCGKPRSAFAATIPVAPDDPDPLYHTFCAFISPGGA